MNTVEPTEAQLAAIERLMTDERPVQPIMSRFQLWSLCLQVQLASRHPDNNGPHRHVAEDMVRQFLEYLTADDPVLAELSQLNWKRPIVATEAASAQATRGIRHCRECGCTDIRGCPGGCTWVEPDLCSRCANGEPIIIVPSWVR